MIIFQNLMNEMLAHSTLEQPQDFALTEIQLMRKMNFLFRTMNVGKDGN